MSVGYKIIKVLSVVSIVEMQSRYTKTNKIFYDFLKSLYINIVVIFRLIN